MPRCFTKISKFLLILFLITSWIFSGWPQIFNFPPKIQKAQAAWGVPKIGSLVEQAGAAGAGDITLVEPAGIAQGDLMVACIGYRGSESFSLPSGWALVATQQSSGDVDPTNGIASGVMAYIVRGAAAPDLIFTRTITVANGVAQGRIIAYSGGSATPYDTGSANTLAAAALDVTTASITTAEANELIVAMVSVGDADTTTAFDAATDPTTASGATDTTTAPTAGTWIERSDDTTLTGGDNGLAIADAIRSAAGITGTIQATVADDSRNVMIAGAFKMIPPSTYEQSAYRWFNNLDSTDVGTPLAAQDTTATLGATGALFRLRMLLHIGTAQLVISGQTFKLQFAQQSGTCDTGFVDETYADVTAATVIAYKDNTTPADGASLTANANDPTHGADTIVNQTYEELNDFTNSVAAIPSGQDGKWDFSLFDNGATASTAYCLRAVKSDGSVLNTYTVVPQITTSATAPAQSITFSLGATSLPLGALSSTAATTGSHTINVATNAANGMSVTVSGTTLTSAAGGFTITACATGCTSITNSEQFGINLKDNVTPNIGLEASGIAPIGAAATGYATVDNFRFASGEIIASSSGAINDTTFTISYLVNISAATEAGSYTTNLTYVATGTF
ncbi:hypothetical protein KKB43_01150 [Patescibacteria group bacterium]|nr:hypothetical protein [Patescibacteria group bacterium]MBU4579605.1 hypothetical protein [Patescibacteria group bacterium]